MVYCGFSYNHQLGNFMKNSLKINLFTSSSKKMIFVFILLLILPLTGCKSVVKETDVEKPVRIVSPNGDVYVGEVMSGKPHGQGTRTFTNGDKYVGEYKNGLMDGQGTGTYPDGSKYVGEWKDDKMNGQGTYTFSSGGSYVGEWKDGKMTGQGKETYPSGDKYVGEFKDRKRNGQGTYTWSDGRKNVGEFKDGNIWNVRYYDKNGNIHQKFGNGKPLKQYPTLKPTTHHPPC